LQLAQMLGEPVEAPLPEPACAFAALLDLVARPRHVAMNRSVI